MDFPAPRWLPGGHLQTIYPATCIAKPAVAYRRERWDAPDGDFIDIDFVDGRPGQPFLVLFHGLEGSSQSHYCRALMAAVAARGWSGAVPHFRGCSGQINRAPRFYHSGDAAEVDWILRRLAAHRMAGGASKFYAAGASLGGNALLRWLGESQHQAEFVDAACAISAPLDLAGGGAALTRGFNRIYGRMFLHTMKSKSLQKLRAIPRPVRPRADAARARPVCVRQYRHRAAARLPRHRRLLEPRQRQARAGRHHAADAGAECAERPVPAGPFPAAQRRALRHAGISARRRPRRLRHRRAAGPAGLAAAAHHAFSGGEDEGEAWQ